MKNPVPAHPHWFAQFGPIAVGLIAVGLLSACTSSTGGSGSGTTSSTAAASSTPGSATVTPTTPPTVATTVTATATVTATSSAGESACTNAQIAVSWATPPGGGAAGHDGVVLLFTNHSGASCVLSGYPGVAGLDSSGHDVLDATRTLAGMIGFCGCSTPPVLTVRPGDVVSAVVEGEAGGPGPCTAFPAMLVTPPNTTVATRIDTSPYSCGFTVHPVVTGHAGQGH